MKVKKCLFYCNIFASHIDRGVQTSLNDDARIKAVTSELALCKIDLSKKSLLSRAEVQ